MCKCKECSNCGWPSDIADERDSLDELLDDVDEDNMHDEVNHPDHYTWGGIETIDVIEGWGLGYHLGNVVKYISRANHKGKYLQDLKKAQWYLNRRIAVLEGEDE